ncbi:hypothetical protein LG296_04655 [Ureibacillus chungkukjangi]|uniref:hypothetical protein n=1 Tax=Ureibacillus chungkukjangi TaxID=1202712 RepID=UPI00384FA7F8
MLEMAVMGKREGLSVPVKAGGDRYGEREVLSVPLNARNGFYGEKRRVVSAPKC